MLVREIANVATEKTVMTYLPPINAPVNEFSTIFGFLTYMQKLCKEVNMPYVNITLDLGAAMPAYKVVWNYPNIFSNVIIHLGDFRCSQNVNWRIWIRGYRFSVWNIYDWIPEWSYRWYALQSMLEDTPTFCRGPWKIAVQEILQWKWYY